MLPNISQSLVSKMDSKGQSGEMEWSNKENRTVIRLKAVYNPFLNYCDPKGTFEGLPTESWPIVPQNWGETKIRCQTVRSHRGQNSERTQFREILSGNRKLWWERWTCSLDPCHWLWNMIQGCGPTTEDQDKFWLQPPNENHKPKIKGFALVACKQCPLQDHFHWRKKFDL